MVVTIWVVVTFNFFLFRILPGDPAKAGIFDPRLKPEIVQAIREQRGLNKPIFLNLNGGNPLDSQYFIYLRQLLGGDLGISYGRNIPVAQVLAPALGNTLLLVLPAEILAMILGTVLGLLAAWRHGTFVELAALIFSLLMWSLPLFFLGLVLLFWGSNQFGLPIGGKETIGATYADVWAQLRDVGTHMLLPVLSLTLVLGAQYVLVMRSSILDVFTEDYILVAKAKGLSTFAIIKDHAFRNALLPLVTLIALNLGFAIAGAIQTETVFTLPGVGRAIVEAVNFRDYPVLQGAFLLIATAVVIANALAEITYGVLDPRTRA